MREYEVVVVVEPMATEVYLKELDKRVSKLVETYKGHLFFVRPWGKRAFAYPIKKKKEGFYIHYDFSGDGAMVTELERQLRLDEKILRFITVQIADKVDIAARKEQLEKQLEQQLIAKQALEVTHAGS